MHRLCAEQLNSSGVREAAELEGNNGLMGKMKGKGRKPAIMPVVWCMRSAGLDTSHGTSTVSQRAWKHFTDVRKFTRFQ